jgi:hypothetical protein
MNKLELLKQLVGQNDTRLKKAEDKLTKEVDQIYKRAVAKATEEFRALEKVSPDAKVDSKEVRAIIQRAMKAYDKEFEQLAGLFQAEITKCYDESLEETSLLIGANEMSAKEKN